MPSHRRQLEAAFIVATVHLAGACTSGAGLDEGAWEDVEMLALGARPKTHHDRRAGALRGAAASTLAARDAVALVFAHEVSKGLVHRGPDCEDEELSCDDPTDCALLDLRPPPNATHTQRITIVDCGQAELVSRTTQSCFEARLPTGTRPLPRLNRCHDGRAPVGARCINGQCTLRDAPPPVTRPRPLRIDLDRKPVRGPGFSLPR